MGFADCLQAGSGWILIPLASSQQEFSTVYTASSQLDEYPTAS